MDSFSGYNQIQMASEDREKTFINTWGTFYYKTQECRSDISKGYGDPIPRYDDMMYEEIKVYVDDMIAKLNLAKCTFGVKSGKLLGFIVNEKGIEVDPDKVKAIREMPAPRTKSKEAFKKIKKYLKNLPILVLEVPRRPLILYLEVLEKSIGCVLRQQDATRKEEQAIYYLSKKVNLLRFGLRSKKAEIIHAGQHYMTNIQDRPHQVHLQEIGTNRANSMLANGSVRIQHCIHEPKSHKRERPGRTLGSSPHIKLLAPST
ncbi:Retrovirus-related Pol polyprotein from transposon gypsy, partial [Mucuna pruriens]